MNNQDNELLKDNSKRAKLIMYAFSAICIINAISLISGYFEYLLLDRANNGEIISEVEATANDSRQQIIAISQIIINLSLIVLFLMWFRRTYDNVHRVYGVNNMNHSRTMAVWSFIIPIVSLYRPYHITKEIVEKTKQKISEKSSNYKTATNPSIIGIWWALYLITNILGHVTYRMSNNSETIQELITMSKIYMLSDFLNTIAAIITLLMIKQISADENFLFKNYKEISIIEQIGKE